jgi:putative ABC transport system permease protein
VQGREPSGALANVVGPRFFETLGVPLLQGRPFGPTDAANAPPVVIVNQTLARRFFDGKAVGQRLRVDGDAAWSEIVGVVADSKYVSLEQGDAPTLYVPLSQNNETGVTLYVRAADAPGLLVAPVRDALRSLEPNLPATNVSLGTDVVATTLYSARMGATLLAVLGGLALALAAVGIYGVLAFSTSRRTHEIGIRSALGADARDVLGLIVREGMTLVAIGVGIGLIGSIFAARAIESYLFGIRPIDGVTFVAGPLMLGGIALAACLIPAWRATRVDPTTALRTV